MADYQLLDCFQPELVLLERVKFFNRQLLTADDMVTDQDYFRQKLRRHNRFLHGWGVVCGLEVTAVPTTDLPWRVKIDSGYALGPFGDEIYVAEPVYLNLARCGPGAAPDPCEPDRLHPAATTSGGPLYVAIKYAECMARPVRAMPAGCACEEEACEYSRIRDSFQIECLDALPASHQGQAGPTLCELISDQLLLPCPPCPTEPWVVLAAITLPSPDIDITIDITDERIDNMSPRRQLFSTAVLQEQLIQCCCEEEEEPQPTPSADLSIKKVWVKTDEPLTFAYKITVTNHLLTEAQNVVVKDECTLDSYFASNFEGAWTRYPDPPFEANFDELGAGESVELSYTLKVDPLGQSSGSFQNTATVESETPRSSDTVLVTTKWEIPVP
jgi:hypothetical protein